MRLQIAGRDVQLTLRGADEWAVLARLEEVLQRYPAPQTPPQTPPADATPQCPQHGALEEEHQGQGLVLPA
jgi:hypothetical protein